MYPQKKLISFAIKAAALIAIITVYFAVEACRHSSKSLPTKLPPNSIALTGTQVKIIKDNTATTRQFLIQREAVGSIDFDEDMSLPIYPSYPGKVIKAFVDIGEDVKKGQTLFTIDSPDLMQAESTLIAAAGVFDLTTKTLARAMQLYKTQGIAQKDLQQAISDQQTAEGAYKAALDAVRLFGITKTEVGRILATRKIDSTLVVSSPFTGRITQRAAVHGLFVQPGVAPAPYAMADISKILMIGNIPETDSSLIRLGQLVKVSVMAYPDEVFNGKITTIWASVDPILHTLLIRSKIANPQHKLLPGMLANVVILIGSRHSPSVLSNSVIRAPDGTMTVWIKIGPRLFQQRQIHVGIEQDGYTEVLDGLKQGEAVVSEGAIFLDNMLNINSAA